MYVQMLIYIYIKNIGYFRKYHDIFQPCYMENVKPLYKRLLQPILIPYVVIKHER